MPDVTFNIDGVDFSINILSEDSNRGRVDRDGKGSSVISSLSDYIAIDIETTGLDPSYDEIIEVAAVHVLNGTVVDSFETLVKPQNEVDSFITDLTGITNEMLSSAPNISEVLPSIHDFLGSAILVGHNVSFDVNFLYDNFSSYSSYVLSNDYIDTMRFWRLIERDLPHHRLKDAVKHYNHGCSVEHRALSDAILAHRLYEILLTRCAETSIDLNALWKHKIRFKSS